MLIELNEAEENELLAIVIAWRIAARNRGEPESAITPEAVVLSLIHREHAAVGGPPTMPGRGWSRDPQP